ncbi:hypothetical protein HDU67_003833 [Dinochytrium kinnereticum]|nr:hypothetical protein HDU67_003833 [Dinochytrium kinnereticum]
MSSVHREDCVNEGDGQGLGFEIRTSIIPDGFIDRSERRADLEGLTRSDSTPPTEGTMAVERRAPVSAIISSNDSTARTGKTRKSVSSTRHISFSARTESTGQMEQCSLKKLGSNAGSPLQGKPEEGADQTGARSVKYTLHPEAAKLSAASLSNDVIERHRLSMTQNSKCVTEEVNAAVPNPELAPLTSGVSARRRPTSMISQGSEAIVRRSTSVRPVSYTNGENNEDFMRPYPVPTTSLEADTHPQSQARASVNGTSTPMKPQAQLADMHLSNGSSSDLKSLANVVGTTRRSGPTVRSSICSMATIETGYVQTPMANPSPLRNSVCLDDEPHRHSSLTTKKMSRRSSGRRESMTDPLENVYPRPLSRVEDKHATLRNDDKWVTSKERLQRHSANFALDSNGQVLKASTSGLGLKSGRSASSLPDETRKGAMGCKERWWHFDTKKSNRVGMNGTEGWKDANVGRNWWKGLIKRKG